MSTFDSRTGKLSPQSFLYRRYQILRLIGRGGMSAIYLALDLKMNQRRVAIKEMSQENLLDSERDEAEERFRQEARLLGRLSHPNLPHIYDFFIDDNRSYLVMDYIEGKTLLQLLQEANQPLPVDRVLSYAEQLCDVLSYLHQQNPPVIFRDLKPTNVMTTQEGHVYLIDFGIARFFKEGKSQDTVVLGSPGYAPPEQHGIGQTTPRSDLYALGATLYCCLTNQDPYHAEARFVFAPVRQYNPAVPEELDHLVAQLLSVDENQRPTSAMEVKQALLRIAQQRRRPPAAPAPTPMHPQAMPPRATPIPPSAPPRIEQTIPAFSPAGPQGRLVLGATPLPPPNQSRPYAQPPMTPYPASGQMPRVVPEPRRTPTRVWTPGFILLFILLLIVTVFASSLAFNLGYVNLHPYTNNPTAGLDHALEASLAILALVLCFIAIVLARSFIATAIILLDILALLAAFAIFLLQTLRDVQPLSQPQILSQIPPEEMNLIITGGLLALGAFSLFWLFRPPFTWGDRVWLFLFSAAICTCAYLQISFPDSIPPDQAANKHLLLLAALVLFIQGLITACQMERKRIQPENTDESLTGR